MIDILSWIFAMGVGFGFSCWFFGNLLEKSNNIGDSRGDKYEYRVSVTYSARRDKLSRDDRRSFPAMYAENINAGYAAPKGSELVRRLTREELNEFRKTNVPRGAHQSDANHINEKEFVDEFEEWEKRAGLKPDLKGIFKPVDEDPNP